MLKTTKDINLNQKQLFKAREIHSQDQKAVIFNQLSTSQNKLKMTQNELRMTQNELRMTQSEMDTQHAHMLKTKKIQEIKFRLFNKMDKLLSLKVLDSKPSMVVVGDLRYEQMELDMLDNHDKVEEMIKIIFETIINNKQMKKDIINESRIRNMYLRENSVWIEYCAKRSFTNHVINPENKKVTEVIFFLIFIHLTRLSPNKRPYQYCCIA